MTADPQADAVLALHRFGLGPRPGSIAAIAADPRGAILAELDVPGAGRISDPGLLTSGEAAREAFNFQLARRTARLAERAAKDQLKDQSPPAGAANRADTATDMPSPGGSGAMSPPAAGAAPANPGPGVPQQIYRAEAKARIDAALAADIGFVERLVWFWSNHFCVSADKGVAVRALAGAYEREAIRPHVLGRFADLLLAVETHPAMLIYLDNAGSIGPESIAGINRGKGLNENLAREIMELHTLGVRTGYTQDDVTRFANVITGWTVQPPRQDPVHGGEFMFNPRMHQPGPQQVIGRGYADEGFAQGRSVLDALARHPATARHIAAKLARAFVADDPPKALVERLSQRFAATDGDLREVSRMLVTDAEAWGAPRSKLKRPGEWIFAALRATGVVPPDPGPVIQAQNLLGEPLWRPPAPNGFADDSAAWMDGLAQRLDVANMLARRVAASIDPDGVAEVALGPLASAETRQALARAESRPQALALLLMSPEFQRR
ncbi:MAG: DUF1800 domain-containing protein [Xanthobacteraceae bacterium]